MVTTSSAFAPAHGAFLVLLVVTVVGWAVLEVRQGLHRRAGSTHADRGSQFVVRIGVGLGVLGAIASVHVVPAAKIEPEALAACLGLLVLWCGVVLRLWCFHTLGTYFTFTVQTSSDQPIITSGPYRVLRHPSYAGILLAFCGVGFFIDNWLSVLSIAVGTVLGLAYRIRVEERAMTAEMGERYRTFAASRKRLVPFVW